MDMAQTGQDQNLLAACIYAYSIDDTDPWYNVMLYTRTALNIIPVVTNGHAEPLPHSTNGSSKSVWVVPCYLRMPRGRYRRTDIRDPGSRMSRSLQLAWLAVAVVICVCIRTGVIAQTEDTQKMSWVSASNATALCNDYTRAGFFIRRNESSRDWVVFLESGGLCYNTESCNRRFFVRQVASCYNNIKLVVA